MHCLSQAAQRKQTLLIAAFYKTWPRLTFVYVYLVSYYEIFLSLVQSQFPGGGAGEATTVWRTGEELSYESEVGGAVGGANVMFLSCLSFTSHFHQLSAFADTFIKPHPSPPPQDLSEPTYRQLLAFTVEILLIPHFIVAWYAWSWWDMHPWVASAVILHCTWAMLREGQAAIHTVNNSGNWRANWRAKIPDLFK